MPALKNTKHEAFAQHRFKGESVDQAYQSAGFKANRGNAARLNANESIRARITELQEAAAKRTAEAISFEAVDLFTRLEQDIQDAKKDKDHKAAATMRIAMIEAFGYRDHPTLTHEHVKKSKIDLADSPPAPGGDEPGDEGQRDVSNLVRFNEVVKMVRKANRK